MIEDALAAVAKLARYAYARDRSVDREPRTIELTDDEAAALLDLLDAKSRTFPPRDGRTTDA